MILAVSGNNVIGIKNGGLPWSDTEEMKHFKETTMGNKVVMGYNTFKSLGFKPLKGRTNYVYLERQDEVPRVDGVTYIKYKNDLIELLNSHNTIDEPLYVIGGKKLYELAENYVDEIILSVGNFKIEDPSLDLITYKPPLNTHVCIDHSKEAGVFKVYRYIHKDKGKYLPGVNLGKRLNERYDIEIKSDLLLDSLYTDKHQIVNFTLDLHTEYNHLDHTGVAWLETFNVPLSKVMNKPVRNNISTLNKVALTEYIHNVVSYILNRYGLYSLYNTTLTMKLQNIQNIPVGDTNVESLCDFYIANFKLIDYIHNPHDYLDSEYIK